MVRWDTTHGGAALDMHMSYYHDLVYGAPLQAAVAIENGHLSRLSIALNSISFHHHRDTGQYPMICDFSWLSVGKEGTRSNLAEDLRSTKDRHQ